MSAVEKTHVENAPEGDDTESLLERFKTWDKRLDAHWGGWLKDAEKEFEFLAGRQWEQDDIDKLREEGRVPVTFNRVQPTIDAISGAEIMGRQRVIYEPRQVESSGANEVLSKAAEWVQDRCDAEHEESEASRDLFVCGVGITETRMSYDEEPTGQIVVERVDPLEVLFDPSSRKANFSDARYLRRKRPYSPEEFEELFPSGSGEGPDRPGYGNPVVVDPLVRYTNGSDNDSEDSSVWVNEYQWFDTITAYRVLVPGQAEPQEVDAATLGQLQALAKKHKHPLNYSSFRRRKYRRAFVSNGQVHELQDIEVGGFTYTAMTGKRDRNKGTWYGLMRPMMDPARFANKFFSQILHIINSNAKGGLMIEEGAVNDIAEFERSWASTNSITYVQPGVIAGGQIKDKTPPAYPQGIDRLMEMSITSVRDVTGVNQEMLGLADREQAGVLEHQRKQAAYGLLANFFDSIRRYRKMQGRLLLKFMQKFIPDDTLVRIVGDDGTAQYVAIASQPVMGPDGKPVVGSDGKPQYSRPERALSDETIEYDVIVDDTAAGPNQKVQTFQMLMQMMPMLQQADMPADVWAEFVRNSPIPAAMANKIAKGLVDAETAKQQDPQAQMQQQLQVQAAQADIADKQASAAHHQGQAALLNARANVEAGSSQQAKDRLDNAKAAKIESEIVNGILGADEPQGPTIY